MALALGHLVGHPALALTPRKRGEGTKLPLPLVGEGWGEGALV